MPDKAPTPPYSQETIFSKIIAKEIPANIIYEDAQSLVFEDINAQAPTHWLIIPKQCVVNLTTIEASDKALLGHLLWVAHHVAKTHKIEDYRLNINNGEKAGQTVFHLHIHLLAGRGFSWPPG